MVKFGIIANTHGIKGHVKILTNSDFKEKRLSKGSKLVLEDKWKKEKITVTVSSWKTNNGHEIVKLRDFDNINDVEKFKGFNIFVEELTNDDLNDDEYLFSDLQGCVVYNQYGEQKGKVSKVVNFGGDDLLQVRVNEENKFIPFIDQFILEVNIKDNKIIVNAIEGLL